MIISAVHLFKLSQITFILTEVRVNQTQMDSNVVLNQKNRILMTYNLPEFPKAIDFTTKTWQIGTCLPTS